MDDQQPPESEMETPEPPDENDPATTDAGDVTSTSADIQAALAGIVKRWNVSLTHSVLPDFTALTGAWMRPALPAISALTGPWTSPALPAITALTGPWISPALPAIMALTGPWMPPVLPNFAELFAPLESFRGHIDTLAKALSHLYPSNWLDWPSEDGPDFVTLVDLADAGYPVCWVPRADVLVDLFNTNAADRPQVLVKHREAILDDCTAALDDVSVHELAELVHASFEAVVGLRQGHFWSAQALASNVVDTALHRAIPPDGAPYYPHVMRQLRQSRDCALREFRRSATFWPVDGALRKFRPHNGDQVPGLYNRHASAHAVGRVQYTEPNALIAVMLAVSMLRELQVEFAEQAGADE